ncbi:MAG: GNAT family N-acetyltransferase [Pseudomonadota bacterium]
MELDQEQIKLRRVRREDYSWIKHWFADPWLDQALGPIDEAWMDHVLAAHDGVELVGEVDDAPVAMIGLVWAKVGQPLHAVTSLAVHPAKRRCGYGRQILIAALQWHEIPKAAGWMAYVDDDNHPPAQMLRSMGWRAQGGHGNLRRFILKSDR